MKSFLAALAVFALLIGGIFTVNALAARRIDAYLAALPGEDLPLPEATERLDSIKADIDERVWLLNGCIHHEKIEELLVLLSSAKAAAEKNDEVEYLIQLSALRQRLLTVKVEFTLTVKDFL